MGKAKLIGELEGLAQSMVQGSLSELTRQCGDPSCACAWDPTRRHGPHLYLRFTVDGKAHSVYVPQGYAQSLKEAHRAWVRFQEVARARRGQPRALATRAAARQAQDAGASGQVTQAGLT